MKNPQSLFDLVQQFLLMHLRSARGLSENTIQSYRDTLRLFFTFVAKARRIKPSRLTLGSFSSDEVLQFLSSLERSRKNSARTRNQRLALLRSFFSYLQIHDPDHAGDYGRILKIPTKRAKLPEIESLEVNEMKTILNSPDIDKRLGLRDRTLLLLMYNSGARASEICDLSIESIDWDGPPVLHIIGKGNKKREVPLWKKTRDILVQYLGNSRREPTSPLFHNPRGGKLTRHGLSDIVLRHTLRAQATCPSLKLKRVHAHTIRHTTATHLYQAGVPLTVIRAWLGHVKLDTTTIYAKTSLKMKQDALSKKKAPILRRELRGVLNKNRDIIQMLKEMRFENYAEKNSPLREKKQGVTGKTQHNETLSI